MRVNHARQYLTAGLGFPPGAPEGFPVIMSVQRTIHGLTSMDGFTALIISFFLFARCFFITRQRAWMVIGLLSFFNITFDHTGIGIQSSATLGSNSYRFGWYSLISGKLRTLPEESPYTNNIFTEAAQQSCKFL